MTQNSVVSMLLLLVSLSALFTGTMVQSNVLDDLSSGFSSAVDSIKQGACVVAHVADFNRCYDELGEYSNKREVEESEIKYYCCAYIRYKLCVEMVAQDKCGTEAASAAESFLSKIQSNVLPSQCDNYTGPIDCLDSFVIIVAAVVAAIVGACILVGLLCLLKRMCC